MTQAELKELLHYNPHSGVWTWLPRPGKTSFNTVHAGKRAGHIETLPNGIRIWRLYMGKRHYLLSRLAILYMTGSLPERVGFANYDSTDLRYINLKPMTIFEHARHRRRKLRDPSGIVGVTTLPNGTYSAEIHTYGKRINLGTFRTREAALLARRTAESIHGFPPNYGQK
jgi:hypothetical protein